MDESTEQIEAELTMLFRRVQSIHITTSSGEMELDRSGYGIMCRLADDGPQRLGMLAGTFGLDPSTITRQVQALEKAGLVVRRSDDSDRRAWIVDLSPEGRGVLDRTRGFRRQRLDEIIADWPSTDRVEFARLLARLNESIRLAVDPPRTED